MPVNDAVFQQPARGSSMARFVEGSATVVRRLIIHRSQAKLIGSPSLIALTSQAIGMLLRNQLDAGIVDVPESVFARSAALSSR